MTYTINGIGTRLSGTRKLSEEEIETFGQTVEPFLYNTGSKYKINVTDCKMSTVSLVFLFIPIAPLYTIILYDGEGEDSWNDDSWQCGKYAILHYPGRYKLVYWNHVLKSWVFYIFPAFLLYSLINCLVK